MHAVSGALCLIRNVLGNLHLSCETSLGCFVLVLDLVLQPGRLGHIFRKLAIDTAMTVALMMMCDFCSGQHGLFVIRVRGSLFPLCPSLLSGAVPFGCVQGGMSSQFDSAVGWVPMLFGYLVFGGSPLLLGCLRGAVSVLFKHHGCVQTGSEDVDGIGDVFLVGFGLSASFAFSYDDSAGQDDEEKDPSLHLGGSGMLHW